MTDERFEQDLDGALDELMAEPASPELRRRVGQVLAQPAGSRARAVRPWQAWLGAGAGIVAVVALAVIVGVGRPSTPAPGAGGQSLPAVARASATASATPEASSTPSATPASPEPTLPDWASQLGMPIAAVLPSVQRTTTPPFPLADAAGGSVTGPFSYAVSDGVGGTGATIEVVDIGGGSVRSVPSPAGAGEKLTQLLVGDTWLVAALGSPAGSCPATGTATAWRIVAAPIGADGMPGAFAPVDAGAMTGKELPFELSGFAYSGTCSDPYVPPLALTGNRLAWAVPANGAADAGSVVKVEWLDTPDVAPAQLVARTHVLGLALSTDAIAWVESSNGRANGGHPGWRVMESDGPASPLARMTAVNIGQTASAEDYGPPDILLDGTTLIVTRSYPRIQATSVASVSGGQIEVLTAKRDSQPCWVFAAAHGRVMMTCGGLVSGDTGARSFLVTWTAAGGLRAVVVGTSFPDPDWVRNSWVGGIIQGDGGPQTYFAIPLDAIAAAAP